ncbi:hypothetical protein FGO68_gene3273 [Halteria grandinella]|uniref:Uncharacterized protein n=1 Tax=Halteria grandinella TaxID=5974 RepID=A0A8J8NHH5_HALGN|nr:hypothetical protein FGO68_gene3273 [Halteria grandinella]
MLSQTKSCIFMKSKSKPPSFRNYGFCFTIENVNLSWLQFGDFELLELCFLDLLLFLLGDSSLLQQRYNCTFYRWITSLSLFLNGPFNFDSQFFYISTPPLNQFQTYQTSSTLLLIRIPFKGDFAPNKSDQVLLCCGVFSHSAIKGGGGEYSSFIR